MADKGNEGPLRGAGYIDRSGSNDSGRDRSNYTVREHIEHIQSNMGSLNDLTGPGLQRYLQKRRYLEEIRYYKKFSPDMLYKDAPLPGDK